MGLFQNLLETYENCSEAVGIVPVDENGNTYEKKTLLPIGHTTFPSEVSVTIDRYGKFITASRDVKPITIVIPCSDDSEGRSGKACYPHALCDKLEYVSDLDKEKVGKYLFQLDSWKRDSNGLSKQILNSVYTYISSGTLLDDLFNRGLFKTGECISDETNKLIFPTKKNSSGNEEVIAKNLGIRFIVNILDASYIVWENIELRQSWIMHSNQTTKRSTGLLFDYISGHSVENISRKHPKKINLSTPNAKLLSCNDMDEFTFRGRFASQNDAVIVDYVQSQKMHQILRWLIVNHGYPVDSQVIVTWAVDKNTEVKAKVQDNSHELFGSMEDVETDSDILLQARTQVYIDYARKLRKILQGYGNTDYIKTHFRKICIAVFDAATTGRMGLVFYQELPENAYLENIINWHDDTSYYLTNSKKVKDEKGKNKDIPINFIGAPSYDDIIFAVYGKSRGDKSYDILKKKIRKQLLECMFGNFAFPKSMVDMAAVRASRPMMFTDSNGKFSESDWEKSINITCALTRKYYKQQKEEIQLDLDTSRTDRDYLFGRLLSVADKLERTALYKAEKQDTRATNAVRLMSSFRTKPSSTWLILYDQLGPYRNQLNGAYFYQSLIDSIMVLFKDGDYENNTPLSPLFLLGYSAQNRALAKNTNNDKTEGKDNVGITK